MVKREINILKGNRISLANEKLLRGIVGQKTTKKLIDEAKRQGIGDLGRSVETQKRRAYRYFADIYNERIQEQNKKEEERKAQEKVKKRRDKEAEKQKRKTEPRVFKWEQINRALLRRAEFRSMFRGKKGKNSPYELTLGSKVVKGVERRFRFANMFHLTKWLDGVEDDTVVVSDSSQSKRLAKVDNFKDIFENATVSIRRITGGLNSKVWKPNYHKDIVRELKLTNYNVKALDIKAVDKGDCNCGFKCIEYLLNKDIDIKYWRNEINVPARQQLTPEQVAVVYNEVNNSDKNLVFIDQHYEGDFDDNSNYIVYRDNHYVSVDSWEVRDYVNNDHIKRGKLAFDIETREVKTEVVFVGETPTYLLNGTILSMVFQPSRGKKFKQTFITDRDKNCCVKFIEWLSEEASEGRYYNIIAHNGARFDFYLIMSYFKQNDIDQCEPQFRNTSIIGFNYKNHLFKDPCCFLTNSLKNLCKGYLVTPEEKAFCKLTKIKIGDMTLTNEQLCFYKPELDFWEFMELEKTDPQFWNEYIKYCEYDCESLYLVWDKFKEQLESIVNEMGNKAGFGGALWGKLGFNKINTIGSLAKRLLELLNTKKLKDKTKDYKLMSLFVNGDTEKYEFVMKFKRGGISHSNQMGIHREGICGYDIKSQYPTAMEHMMIPCGPSDWIYEYNERRFGFYQLKNMVWKEGWENKFKPIAESERGMSLDWAYNITDNYVDSYMIKYLIENCGLLSFDVEVGLVSQFEMRGSRLFGIFIGTLYELKKVEDDKKKEGKPFNTPFREACKLLMNSLSGKLVEDPSRYFRLEFDKDGAVMLNGVGVTKVKTKETIYAPTKEKLAVDKRFKQKVGFGCGWTWRFGVTKAEYDMEIQTLKDNNIPLTEAVGERDVINPWLVCGVMVYSYSKRLLWEYVGCLPNGADDVTHVETDGLYFGKPNQDMFLNNVSKSKNPLIKVGEELGNVENEVTTQAGKEGEGKFLGKKFYMIGQEVFNEDGSINYDKSKMRIKGIRTATISDDGSKIDLIDSKFYENIYNGKEQTRSFKTMNKKLWGKDISIYGYTMTRTTKPLQRKNYNVYTEGKNGTIIKQPWRPYHTI